MPFDRDEQTEGPARNREVWIMLVGFILCLSGSAVVILSHYDLVKLGATGYLVGFSLFVLLQYLHSRLSLIVALSLVLGILGIVLAPSALGTICLIATTVLLISLSGLWWWKVKRARRV